MDDEQKKRKRLLPNHGRKATFEEAQAATIKQFGRTFEMLAKHDRGELPDIPDRPEKHG